MSIRPILKYFSILALIALSSAIFNSCTKAERDEDTETISARDNALAYHIFDDAFRQVHRFAMRDTLLNDTGLIQKRDVCIRKGTLSDTVAIFPLYLNLNYSDDTANCDDGSDRYGVILASFSGKYLNEGTDITIDFDGYRKDLYDVEGKIIVSNMGLNTDGRRYYKLVVTDGEITGNNIDVKWEGEHEMVWVAGSSTDEEYEDDIFQISGEAKGRASKGNSFENEITSVYISDLSCPWFQSGKSELTIPNLQLRYIDYGTTGTCDNVISQTRDLTTFEVEIPRGR